MVILGLFPENLIGLPSRTTSNLRGREIMSLSAPSTEWLLSVNELVIFSGKP